MVFPEGHAVTQAILNDAESSKLSNSAIIALHGEEGRKTRSLPAPPSEALRCRGMAPRRARRACRGTVSVRFSRVGPLRSNDLAHTARNRTSSLPFRTGERVTVRCSYFNLNA
jgi:hypothetical protein